MTVAEDCAVTYAEPVQDPDALTETVAAVYSCKPIEQGGEKPTPTPDPEPEPEPEPEVKTKTVCDTVYALEKTKKGAKWVYNRTGDFTTANCVTVAEDCAVTYAEPVQDPDALTETVAAVYSCKAIKED